MTETLEVVDLCLPGLNCPMPVLRAKKALAKMAGGTLLRVVSTDRHSLADLAGSGYPALAPFIGALGSFITGSNARNRDSGAAATAAHPGMPSPARPSSDCER